MDDRDGRAAPGEVVTHASMLRIAVPIMLSNATVPLIGYVDTAVVGQLGEAHLIGAVAIGGVIFSFLYWTFSFLRMGTTGLTAQAYGASDSREIAGHLLRALAVAGVFGIAMIALQRPIAAASFWAIGPSRQVQAAADTYYSIRIWAAPAGLINFALLGWFIGLGRAGVAFVVQLVVNILNMALAILFVLWLDGGVAGVGLAALIAEVAGAVVGIVVAIRIARQMGAAAPLSDARDWLKMKRSLGINADLTIRAIGHYTAIIFFTAQGAAAGDVTLAANAILMTLIHIMVYLLDGFAFAAEALVGRSVGARDKVSFWRAVRMSTVWAGVLAAIIGDGEERRGTSSGRNLPRVGGTGADPWRVVLPTRRHFHRRDAHARDAQHDGAEHRAVFCGLVAAGADHRQSRPLGGVPAVLHRAIGIATGVHAGAGPRVVSGAEADIKHRAALTPIR